MTDAPPRTTGVCGLVHPATKRYGLIFGLLLITVLALAVPAGAADVTIDASGSSALDISNISAAISAAGSSGTVILNPGTYYANGISLSYGYGITIRANASYGGTAANTIIDGMNAGSSIFVMPGGNVLRLDNLTLLNGHADNGGAIHKTGGTLAVTSVIFSGCTADTNGGAIDNDQGRLSIDASTFTGCSAGSNGGAIYHGGFGTITAINSSMFSECMAEYGNGGAIYNDNSMITAINSSMFSGCTAGYGSGGAIQNNGGTIESITASTFTGCTADNAGNGGAIGNIGQGNITFITSGIFSDCRAINGGNGGAIYNDGTHSNITSIASGVFSNCTTDAEGGAIYNADEGLITSIASGAFSNCTAGTAGGAIANENTAMIPSITSGTFSNCSAENGGYGGGIYNGMFSEITSITSSSFTGCTADGGGSGGAIFNGFTLGSIHFSRFYDNSASDGPAVSNGGASGTAAENNWWGSNSDPLSQVSASSPVTTSPWLVLNASAVPSSITLPGTSAIRMNLTNASDGTTITDTTSGGIFVPEGIPVAYSLSGVTGSLGPTQGNITTGANSTIFTPSSGGTALITVTVDGQQVTVPVQIGDACRDTVTLNSGGSIAGAVSDVCDDGTIILEPGTYQAHRITIEKNLTIRAAGGSTAADIVIDGMKEGDRIFTIMSGYTLALDNLTLHNGTAERGGAIYNLGTVSASSVAFSNCTANDGGAIYSNSGAVTITGSSFTGCTASHAGGVLYSTGGIITVTDSTFSSCTAPGGGAFNANSGTLIIISSTFTDCSATGGAGGAISAYNEVMTMNFSRIYHCNTGTAVVNAGGSSIIAENNWWGTNDGSAAFIGGEVDADPWLELGITADPASITTAQTSAVRANLTFDSSGYNTAGNGHVPDGIPVAYFLSGVTGSLAPEQGNVTTGANSTVFDPAATGTATITVTVDGENVPVTITVGAVPTTAPTTAPTTVPTTTTTTAVYATLSADNDDDTASVTPTKSQADTLPLMTVTVNIGGDSKAWQAIVTGMDLKDLIVTGTVQNGAGGNITAPPGIVYQYISLVPARYNTITKAVINFTVPQAWLDENHIAPGGIVLYHQTANGWVALPTTVLYTKDGTVYFSAQSDGFSLFAIAGTPGTTAPAAGVTVKKTGSQVQDLPQVTAIATRKPVAAETTAPPAPPVPATGFPFMTAALIIAGCVVLIGGGWYVRRWWIRRQNPALFRKYD
jgi:hypothetical protein